MDTQTPTPPLPEPFLTVRFYADGTVKAEPGTSRFPQDQEHVKKLVGSCFIVLLQIVQLGYSRMIEQVQQQASLRDMLERMPTQGDPQ